MAETLRVLFARTLELFGNLKTPNITLSTKASESLVEFVTRENPALALAQFLGVGSGNSIEAIYKPDQFSRKSILSISGRIATYRTDPDELKRLFYKAENDGALNRVLLIGRLQPGGKIDMRHTLLFSPRETDNDEPSAQKKLSLPGTTLLINDLFLTRPDILTAREFREKNPELRVPFTAIATASAEGPAISVYSTERLIREAQSRRLAPWNIPGQIIKLI